MDTREALFGGNMPLYSSALNAYALRQRTIAKNIANATTPGYRPERVRFEEEFQDEQGALRTARADGTFDPKAGTNVTATREAAPIPKPEIYFGGESSVNVDREMSELAQNQIRFRLASRFTQKYFQGLQSAIRGTTL